MKHLWLAVILVNKDFGCGLVGLGIFLVGFAFGRLLGWHEGMKDCERWSKLR